jgi:dynein assembly factor 3
MGTRYDNRANLVDWDYQFGGLKDRIPFLNRRDYKDWRVTGLAFELRLAANSISNKTMGSYAEGKSKKTKLSCKARGFWGDII